MLFGFHISIAGGLERALARAAQLECRTMQIFIQSPRSWQCRMPAPDICTSFRTARAATDIDPLVVHMPYLPNLASTDPALYKRSVRFLALNLAGTRALGASYLVVHPGNRGTASAASAAVRIGAALAQAWRETGGGVQVLLENTAGQGSECGATWAELQMIIEASGDCKPGLCLDTAHAFAAGFDLASAAGLEACIAEIRDLIGIEQLRLLHLNDSKFSLGSHRDRHWHIGKGCIGLEGFRGIINHPALAGLAAIMETPKKTDSDDRMNLKRAKSLLRE